MDKSKIRLQSYKKKVNISNPLIYLRNRMLWFAFRRFSQMEKSKILRKVLHKLGKTDLKEKQVYDILYTFVHKLDFEKPTFTKSMRITEEQHSTLREVYDQFPVEQLYSFGFGVFGFRINNIQVDVQPSHVKIIKKK
jgi:hypothetical protein